MSRVLLVSCLLSVLSPPVVHARRHLLTIAAHRSGPGGEPLKYAKQDAMRVESALADVGGVLPMDSVMLVDPDPDQVRAALTTLATQRVEVGDTLVVYVSSHMDSSSLHLGPEHFAFSELFDLARATQASLRIFVLDGCRSGSVTRKGVHRTGPARLLRPRPQPAAGEIVLTSTSPSEDALESDKLAGSFFTHYLVAGLRGAADADGDRRVSLQELLRFAHDATVYATAASPIGSQHPSFRLDLAGAGATVIAELGAPGQRGTIFEVVEPMAGVAYLLLPDKRHLVAELPLSRPGILVVPSGTYRIRVATPRDVREVEVTMAEGSVTRLDEIELSPIPLLHLLRKGQGISDRHVVLRLEVEGAVGGSADLAGALGGRFSVAVEYRTIAIHGEISYRALATNPEVDNHILQDVHHALALGGGIGHGLEMGNMRLEFGIGIEVGLLLGRERRELMTPPPPSGEISNQAWFSRSKEVVSVGIIPILRFEIPAGSRLLLTGGLRGAVMAVSGDFHFLPGATIGVGWVI